MGGPGVVLIHTLPMGTLSSLGRMLACCEGNSHGHLPGSREHGTEQSQFGRGKKGRGVGCRHSMAQGRPRVRARQQGARGQRSKVFMCGGHWCPSPPARPFPPRPPALPSSPPACGLPGHLPSVCPSTALTPLHQLSWAAVLTLPQPP